MVKKVSSSLLGLLLIVALLATAGIPAALAAPPAQEDAQTIVDVAAGDERFSTLVDLLEQAGLTETLRGEVPVTVFAPTNAAFDKLPQEQLTELQNNPEQLRNVLLYHVVDGRVTSADALRITDVPTMAGSPLRVALAEDDTTVQVNGVEFVEMNIEATNGVIHAIDTVLLPPEGEETDEAAEPGDVETAETSAVQIAACVEDYVIQADDWLSRLALRYYNDPLFYSAISEATNLAAQDDDTYTLIEDPDVIEIGQKVCIPSDRGAQAIMSGLSTVDEDTPAESITPLDEAVDMEDMQDESIRTTDTMTETATTDQTIVDVLIQDEEARFDNLFQAIQTANLVETLQGEGPFTLFAPTDQAFQDLPEGMLGELFADEEALRNVLLYHVIDGRATSADVIRMDAAPMLSGVSAAVVHNPDENLLMVGNATVIEEDIEATNGIVHIVDSVLLPPTDPNPVDSVEE